MKNKPKLIVVTGLPASGKTWLATEISKALNVPLFTKDELKVEILKNLGKKDRAWDIQVGTTAVHIQIMLAKALLARNVPVILESNFKEEFDAPLIRSVIDDTACDCLQIVCGAIGAVLIERFRDRESLAERLPFHFATNVEEFIPKLSKGFQEPLNLLGKSFTVDTTDFAKVDLNQIVLVAREFLAV